MTYKEAVKKLRLKMLMTQEEFAKLLDVSFATINRWETGKYVPTIKARRKLQPYFEKQFDDLSIGEKKIIGSIYFSEDAVGYYSMSNGTIGLLLSKLFLVRTTNISTGFQQFPYALQS
jgi:putative transcriptional regulator